MNTLDRQCEKFLGGPTVAFGERVHVTLDSSGTIYLNAKAHRMMGRPQAVYLYFNRQKDTIILEPTQAGGSAAAFTLIDAKNSARRVYANPFCKHFGIKVDGTQRFVEPEADAAGRLFLSLSATVSVSHHRRMKQSSMK